ncbi:MAG: MBL fold metallo-hydrolase [bacterium]|nr:MBL fold metallo-hydrolase [bacterium]
MRFGESNLELLSDGKFWLDGGAMFGIVPKVIWNRLNPADSENRIELGLNCLLIQVGDKNILVDTGIGEKMDEKFKGMYRVDKTCNLNDSLQKLGLSHDSIGVVINTHLHFDHCGGNTRIENGKLVPSFPNAKYVIQRGEWDAAINPNERTRASYLKENLVPIEEAGLLNLIDGDTEIVPGVKTIVTGGHTAGHQVVLIESHGNSEGSCGKALYLADLIPTTSHIKLPYVMGYDLYPLETMKKKRELLNIAVKEHWLLIFEHDPKIGMGYLSEDEGKLKLNPIH